MIRTPLIRSADGAHKWTALQEQNTTIPGSARPSPGLRVGSKIAKYGPDPVDPFRRTADYVDRILKGEDTADLPVLAPTKFELGTS
jgi:hypothetical protein